MKSIAASLLVAAASAAACTSTQRALTTDFAPAAACAATNACDWNDANTPKGVCQAAPKVCNSTADCADETGYCTGSTATAGVCALCTDLTNSCTIAATANMTQCPTTGNNAGICSADACATSGASTD